jgi:phage baseplate assembly protein W
VEVDFVGAGWAFPPTTDATGGIALVRRDREVAESIRIILGTARGERVMRPEFGCRIHEAVFGPATAATAGQVVADVHEALVRWEPRIDVEEVSVSFDETDAGLLYINIGYRIRGDNDPRNLVFPFYVIPQSEEPPLLPALPGGD